MIAGASPATDSAAVAALSVSAATALACVVHTALPSGVEYGRNGGALGMVALVHAYSNLSASSGPLERLRRDALSHHRSNPDTPLRHQRVERRLASVFR
jgi:hypothetical protein